MLFKVIVRGIMDEYIVNFLTIEECCNSFRIRVGAALKFNYKILLGLVLGLCSCATVKNSGLEKRDLASLKLAPFDSNQLSTVVRNGAWCWFGDPRAIENDQAVYISSITKNGYVQVEQINRDGTRKHKVFDEQLSTDDHNNPSIAFLKDGNIIIFYSEHNGPTLFSSKTTKPGDIESFGAMNHYQIKDQDEVGRGFTYPNIISRVDGRNHELYLFWRGDDWDPRMTKSTDEGKTWLGSLKLVKTLINDQRPYAKYFADSLGRIHMAFASNHPNQNDRNSIYYMVFNGKDFRKADGTIIGDISQLPFRLDELDRVYHPSQFEPGVPYKRAWIWSVSVDKQNQPVMAFSVTDQALNHEYVYANWNSSAWVKTSITSGGKTIQDVENTMNKEVYYSGGVFISPKDSTQIFLSAERVRAHHSIEEWKFDRTSQSASFVRSLTDGSVRSFRPIVPLPDPSMTLDPIFDALWLKGSYYYYTDFETAIEGLLRNPTFKISPESEPSIKETKNVEDESLSEGMFDQPNFRFSRELVRPKVKGNHTTTPVSGGMGEGGLFTGTENADKKINFSDPKFDVLRNPYEDQIDGTYQVNGNFSYVTDTWERLTRKNTSDIYLHADVKRIPIVEFKNNKVEVSTDGSLVIYGVNVYVPSCVDFETVCKKIEREYERTVNLRFDMNKNLISNKF